MNPAGTHFTIARDAFGRVQFLTHFPPRNAATVYPFGAVVLEDGLLYAGDGETAGGVPMPSHFLPRSASVVYPIGSLVYRTDTGRVYRGDGLTAGGILLSEAAAPAATYAKYWGLSASETLDEAGILELGTTTSSTAAGTYSFTLPGVGRYLYFAWRDSGITQATAFALDGIAMAGDFAGAAQGYDQGGVSYPYKIVSVSGVNHRLFRSINLLDAAATISVVVT